MARYIDAEALLDILRSKKGSDALGHFVPRFVKIKGIIDELPTANVMEVDGDINLLKEKKPKEIWVGTDDLPIVYVPVVRCKDCKWWHTDGCAFRKDAVKDLPAADDFCSHGERKE